MKGLQKSEHTKKNSRKIKILRNFEGSNIQILRKKVKNSEIKIKLKIKNDPYKSQVKRKFQNWFYFKVSSIKDKLVKFEITDVNNYDNDWKPEED